MASRPSTKSRGMHTVDDFQSELRTVIDLMGPSSSENTSMIEIQAEEKEVIKKLANEPNAKPIDPNTPRDYSELSSLATDSVAVYEMPECGDGDHSRSSDNPAAPIERKLSELTTRIRQPIRKISSIFKHGKTPTKNPEEDEDVPMIPAGNLDLYRINILQPKSEAAPKRVVFDLVEDPPPCLSTIGTNTTPRRFRNQREAKLLYRNANCKDEPHLFKAPSFVSHRRSEPIIDASMRMQKKTIYQRLNNNKIPGQLDSLTRVDVYYFDHGNSAYYHTTDCPPVIMTEIIAEKTETYTTKFWAETFGFLHIIFSFATSFILQLLRSLLQSFVRPLTVGTLQIASDYCIKPLLATVFNALIQPPLIFIYNVATTFRDICDPLAEGVGYFIREIAALFGAIRLVDVKYCRAIGHDEETADTTKK